MITQVFPDEYHLHTLDQFLSATARLNPQVNVKAIVIGMMDRLSSYATREASVDTPEQRKAAEEEATVRLMEKMKISKAAKAPRPDRESEQNGEDANGEDSSGDKLSSEAPEADTTDTDKASQTNGDEKARGIPDNVRLFEVFHEQVMNLVSMQRLPIQDISALLVSLMNLAL